MHKPFTAIAFALMLCGLPTAATAQFSETQYDFITDKTSAEYASSENADAAATDAAAADDAKADASFQQSETVEEMPQQTEMPQQPEMQSESGESCDASCGDSYECGESEECGDSCECGDAAGCGSACGCDDTCGWFDCCSGLEKIDISDCMGIKECSNLEIGGWTELGFTNNNVPLSQAYNDLLSFNDVPDHLHLNQQWFYFGKKADGSCGLDWGGRIDMVYGTDAQKTQSFGNPGAGVRNQGTFDAPWDNGEYGWAIPQLYGEVAMGDLTTKVGHFFTPMGYEVIPATGNFFYTHSYTFFNSEPFTHTGVISTYTGIEGVTLYGGWSLGWDTGFDQLNSGSNGIAGYSTELTEGATFTYITCFGNFGWRDGGGNDSYNHSIVLDLKLTEDLEYVLQSDNVRTDNDGVSQFDTIGAVNYLFYTVNDELKLGSRAEWWKADGISFYEVTLGPNINVASNLVIRPEWRQDWAPGIGLDEDTFAVDMILSY